MFCPPHSHHLEAKKSKWTCFGNRKTRKRFPLVFLPSRNDIPSRCLCHTKGTKNSWPSWNTSSHLAEVLRGYSFSGSPCMQHTRDDLNLCLNPSFHGIWGCRRQLIQNACGSEYIVFMFHDLTREHWWCRCFHQDNYTWVPVYPNIDKTNSNLSNQTVNLWTCAMTADHLLHGNTWEEMLKIYRFWFSWQKTPKRNNFSDVTKRLHCHRKKPRITKGLQQLTRYGAKVYRHLKSPKLNVHSSSLRVTYCVWQTSLVSREFYR